VGAIVGFTGTRKGMTKEQKDSVTLLLLQVNASEVHHGGCYGADIDFDDICYYLKLGVARVVHPSDLNGTHGRWHETSRVREEFPPLERNYHIVEESDTLIAAPSSRVEAVRSGTWHAVRYARRRKKLLYIVYPDGDVVKE